ncbi:hypothetical protein FACS1894152_6730 [Bacilli bacterium]|nr:hypothetical protein FACS1894152_6730 [Bacilli bacterium]
MRVKLFKTVFALALVAWIGNSRGDYVPGINSESEISNESEINAESSSYIGSYTTMADNKSGTNSEYVYFDGAFPLTDKEIQSDIYNNIASVYRFPMNTNPLNADRISRNDRKELYNRELGFISDKIRTKYPSVHILPIPKSLYQLFVLAELIDGIEAKAEETRVNGIDWSTHEGGIFSDITFGDETIHIGKGKLISVNDACNKYLYMESVQDLSWNVNQRIATSIGDTRLDENKLRNVGSDLLDNLRTKLSSKNILDLWKNSYLHWGSRMSLFSKNLIDDETTVFEQTKQHVIEFLSKEFKTTEDESLRGTSRIYRGGATPNAESIGKVATSFSDGWFGGIINDPHTGMAFDYVLKLKRLSFYDVDKEDMHGVHIPPLSSLGATLGTGEFHHPRLKVLRKNTVPNKKIIGIEFNAINRFTPEQAPELMDDTEDSEEYAKKVLEKVTNMKLDQFL